MSKASKKQPKPKKGKKIVLGYVLADMLERAEVGRRRYGTYLKTFNGRKALWDAYQESLDLPMYLRQELLERAEKRKKKKK